MTITKSKLITLSLIIGSALLTSCSKEKLKDVSVEDAVELIEASLQSSTAGVNETITKYSELLITDYGINDNCSQSYDTTYTFSYSGALTQANYTINWGYVLGCNLGVPSSVIVDASSSGTYSTSKVKSNDNTSANLNITGVEPSSSTLNFSGDLNRNGSQTITINSNTQEVTSTITLNLTNLTVNKTSYEIESGTGTALVTANNGSDTFSFSGNIVFNGGGSATLTINGNTYTINLN